MPLLKSKSPKAFSKNIETEMHHGKPQPQAIAIAYSMKRKAAKKASGGTIESGDSTMNMADGGMAHCAHGGPMECSMGCYDEGGMIKEDSSHQSEAHEEDMIHRAMAKYLSQGGKVANSDEPVADFEPNEFDDLHLRDDLESEYTAKNSGDEDGMEEHEDIVSRAAKKIKARK